VFHFGNLGSKHSDMIKDFEVGHDHIALNPAVFTDASQLHFNEATHTLDYGSRHVVTVGDNVHLTSHDWSLLF